MPSTAVQITFIICLTIAFISVIGNKSNNDKDDKK